MSRKFYKCSPEEFHAMRWAKAIAKEIDRQILEDMIKEITENECDGLGCIDDGCLMHGFQWK